MKILDSFDDCARERVPDHKTSTWLQIGLVIIGVTIAIPAFLLGSALGNALGLQDTAVAVYGGALILTVVALLTAVVGAKTRLSTYMILRQTFGKNGSLIVIGVIALSLFGWFGINTGVFATSAQTLFEILASTTFPLWSLSLVGGIIMMSTAIVGFRALTKLSNLAVPLLLLLLVGALGSALANTSFSQLLSFEGSGGLPLGVAISIVAGAFMVGAVVIPDLTRYAKSAREAMLAVLLGFLIGFPTIVYLTSVLSVATGQSDFIGIMTALGWTVPALVVLLFASWTTNDNNLYSAALGLSVMFSRTKKWKLAVIAGIAGTLLAIAGILDQFIPWLILLGVVIPPIAGIYIVDHLFLKQKMETGTVNVWALATWVIASGIGYITTPATSQGLGLFELTTIPALDSIIVAFVLYLMVGLFKK